jgi:hypothetical protein
MYHALAILRVVCRSAVRLVQRVEYELHVLVRILLLVSRESLSCQPAAHEHADSAKALRLLS